MQIPCSEFADLLVAFTPGSGGPSEAGVSALGAPDADVVSLGIDATITVAFIGAGAIIDATGNDVRLHLSSSSDASAVAYASEDGDDFRFLGDINGGLDAPLDLDLATPSLSSALQIRIVGTGGNISLDAVEGLSIDCNTP